MVYRLKWDFLVFLLVLFFVLYFDARFLGINQINIKIIQELKIIYGLSASSLLS